MTESLENLNTKWTSLDEQSWREQVLWLEACHLAGSEVGELGDGQVQVWMPSIEHSTVDEVPDLKMLDTGWLVWGQQGSQGPGLHV